MTPHQSCDDVFLTGEGRGIHPPGAVRLLGRARVDQAERRPPGAAVLAQAARDGTAIGHAEYDANLAIDYLDFPRKTGQSR